jgi:antibiotic biosynthesis monooxygenase (ABM) superfamily enzyme
MNDFSSPEKFTEPVSILALRSVKPGFEEKFEESLHDFINRSLQTEGQLGVSVIRPVEGSGSREYGILRRFRDAASRDRFYESSLFKQWEITVASLTEGEAKHQNLSGLETWFVLPGQRALIPPPPWKMALVTVVGVWPASLFVPWVLNPFISDLPSVLQALLVAVGIVILLTWAIMPVLVRILKGWIYPE